MTAKTRYALMAKLLEGQSPTPAVLEQIAVTLAAAEKAIASVVDIARREASEEIRHQDELKDLRQQRRRAQDLCPHLATTYHADAAGGSDSYRSCDHCDAEVKR